jgi:very-short-patch-repair endonuclease
MEKEKPIITGRKVDPDKVQRAKELRRNMTKQEKILWEKLRNNRLGGYHFRRQQVIDGFVIDFYCNPVKLAVEVDGNIHRLRREYDEDRDMILKAEGIEILRLSNVEINNDIEAVLQRILSYCRRKKSQPNLLGHSPKFPFHLKRPEISLHGGRGQRG